MFGGSVPAQLMHHQSHGVGWVAGGLERDLEVGDLGEEFRLALREDLEASLAGGLGEEIAAVTGDG